MNSNVFGLLLPELQRAVKESGYTVPTPVQEKCIAHLLAGRDLLGSAQTGTGKTAAFTLPLLQYLHTHPKRTAPRQPRVLILAPTRELAAQIRASIETYGRHLRLTSTVIFGGVGQRPQENAMNRGVDLLVATPGRLLDLMNQGFIDLRAIEAFVLDEADRMLDMGFIHDVRRVIAKLPARRQSLFFSATLPREVVDLAGTLLRDPVRVTVTPEQPTVERIDQRVMFVEKARKDALLISLLSDPTIDKVIVFTQMKHAANKVADKLMKAGINAAAIHGNKSQTARTAALEGFRSGRVRALVATDIAARGLDVDAITHVINYDLPLEPETYVHRIGRTARAGAAGDAVSFCAPNERDQWRAIERLVRKPVPTHRDHPYHSDLAENSVGTAAHNGNRRGGGAGRNGNAPPANRPATGGRGPSSGRWRPRRASAAAGRSR
ncbi:MAG: DEAD/DEAH box helicase [Verrucomicrobiales bacterium]|nr:DEAD/DEAH box helicase [Verrucomicrobiales bacterium]MCP5526797.1 DEAD/DEAH box helicase [Verrucomicrobiales bacterium]